jgi:phenylpyruvate tautomerase
VGVKVRDECTLTFAGSFDPGYSAFLYSIGKISPEMNLKTSAGLSEFFAKELDLPNDRGTIVFYDIARSNILRGVA